MDNTNLNTFYFTFSCSHENAGKFVAIEGTFESARNIMMERFPDAGGFQYNNREKVSHLEEMK